MNEHPNPPEIEGEIHHLVPADGPTGAPQEMSLAVSLTRAEIDQQIATAKQFPRSLGGAVDAMINMATMTPEMAEECVYAVPRGGKTIRGPSIRFAEIIASCWQNCRDAARVTHVDRIERYVEAEGAFHDLQTNRATVSRVKRTIEIKKGKKTIDLDMIQLAGAAAMSIARRNAILSGVPKVAWVRAYTAVEGVIRGDVKTLVERRDRAVAYFAKAGITTERLLKALEVKSVDDVTLDDLVTMQGWRTSLSSGDANLDELFPEERPPGPKEDKLKLLAERGQPDPEAQRPPTSASGQEAGPPSSSVAAPVSAAPPPPKPDKPAKLKGAAAKEARLAELVLQGDAAARRGRPALQEWLDSLSGDDTALVTPALERLWKDGLDSA